MDYNHCTPQRFLKSDLFKNNPLTDVKSYVGIGVCDLAIEFACVSGGCINATWVCDQAEDCYDGSDEGNCTCSEDQFTCGDGTCIPGTYTCDYVYDCEDFTDEINADCTCDPASEFGCEVAGCINSTWVCDGENDCFDGSDESICGSTETPTTEGKFYNFFKIMSLNQEKVN